MGARAVCELERASPADARLLASDGGVHSPPPSKLAVVTARRLSDAHRHVLRAVRAAGGASAVRCCTIFTAVSEDAHASDPETPLGSDAYQEYASLLAQDVAGFRQASSASTDTPEGARQPATGAGPASARIGRKLGGINLFSRNVSRFPRPAEVGAHGRTGNSPEDGQDVEGEASEPPSSIEVHVRHLPSLVCCLSRSTFVFPSAGHVAGAPLARKDAAGYIGPGLPPATSMPLALSDDNVPSGIPLLAHAIFELLSELSLKPDIFALGATSHAVAQLMAVLNPPLQSLTTSKARQALGSKLLIHPFLLDPLCSVAVVLVDRTLDLTTPCTHADNFVARVFDGLHGKSQQSISGQPQRALEEGNILPRNPSCVKVPLKVFPLEPLMPPAPSASGGKSSSESHLMGGSLALEGDESVKEKLQALLGMGMKEGLLLLRQWLEEALRAEKVAIPSDQLRLGPPSAKDLLALVDLLTSQLKVALRHRAVIQLAAAAAVALEPPAGPRWEALQGAERILSVSAALPGQSLPLQLKDIVLRSARQRGQSLIGLREALGVTLFSCDSTFPVSDHVSQQQSSTLKDEYELKEALVDAIMLVPPARPLILLAGSESLLERGWLKKDQSDGDATYPAVQAKLELRDRVEELFQRFSSIGAMQSRAGDLVEERPLSRPLLHQLADSILTNGHFPGLQHVSDFGVGGFLKSGLGRLGLSQQAKAKPGDCTTVLLFVVGGISILEVSELQGLMKRRKSEVDLLLGGSTLLYGDEILGLVTDFT
eukprot:SM000152S01536  [mRNA]  locus=s152:57840:62455:- [translate_table: standard]